MGNKELKINLDYLAKTYGFEILYSADVETDDHGNTSLILKGDTKTPSK